MIVGRISSATAGIPSIAWLVGTGFITHFISGWLYRSPATQTQTRTSAGTGTGIAAGPPIRTGMSGANGVGGAKAGKNAGGNRPVDSTAASAVGRAGTEDLRERKAGGAS